MKSTRLRVAILLLALASFSGAMQFAHVLQEHWYLGHGPASRFATARSSAVADDDGDCGSCPTCNLVATVRSVADTAPPPIILALQPVASSETVDFTSSADPTLIVAIARGPPSSL